MEGPIMNESHLVGTGRGDGSSVALGFVLGAVVGAGIALLLAPATGMETRQRIADAGRRWRGAARDLAEDLRQEAKSVLETAGRDPDRGQETHETPPASRLGGKV
jgi:gas vesicle protein